MTTTNRILLWLPVVGTVVVTAIVSGWKYGLVVAAVEAGLLVPFYLYRSRRRLNASR